MKPFQSRMPGAQVERKSAAANDDFSFDEKAVALLAGARAVGAWREVAGDGEGGAAPATFPVIPAAGVSQCDAGLDGLDLRSIVGADARNAQELDLLHGARPGRLARIHE